MSTASREERSPAQRRRGLSCARGSGTIAATTTRDVRASVVAPGGSGRERIRPSAGEVCVPDPASYPYDTNLDVLHGPLEVIDVRAIASAITHPWANRTLCRVNDSVVRMGAVRGEYHWHHHADLDEFFFVVEGRLLIDVREPAERTVALTPGQGYVVPRGVEHRTRAPERTVILMVEGDDIVPTGD